MSGGKRQRAGRKATKIDMEQVEKLCNLQCTDAELASFFGVSVRTIERRKSQPVFAECMARGKSRGLLTLRRNLWSLAGKPEEAFDRGQRSCARDGRQAGVFQRLSESLHVG